MHAVIVSVDYSDLLRATLPRNRHHFGAVTIITSPADAADVRPIADANGASLHVTDAFFRRGARFNKWLALEEALDAISRRGWLVLMDADVVWPQVLPRLEWEPGFLYSPLRRMAPWPLEPIPPESEWSRFPVHPNLAEWAGYSQIFHASDERLGPPPWHDVRWLHGGGADSFFQLKWPPHLRIRPPFEVLHLGEAGVNWMGRATPLADGSTPTNAEERRRGMNAMWQARRGKRGMDRFTTERLPES